MKYQTKLLLNIIAIALWPICVQAAWKGPVEIVKGAWGNSPGQFFVYYGESGDFFPKNIGIDKLGRIFVNDGSNRRVQIFDKTGKLEQIITAPPEIRESDDWPYAIYVHPEGALVARFDGSHTYFLDSRGKIIKKVNQYGPAYPVSQGFVFYDTKTKYDLYSLNGEYIKSYPSKPQEIDSRDKRLKYLTIPKNQYRTNQSQTEGHDAYNDLVVEYGELIVAPNGDAYTWKRTTSTYSILKWTWSE